MIPLDLFPKHADPEVAQEAAIDFGYAIKDLAASNIFTGRFPPKNGDGRR